MPQDLEQQQNAPGSPPPKSEDLKSHGAETPPDEYDSPWKEISGRFFPDLVALFVPDLAAQKPGWKPKPYKHTQHQTHGFRMVQLWEIDQEMKMKYVTSIERLSREEGRKEGNLELLLSLAEEKFGPLDESLRKTIEGASLDQVMKWAKRLLNASSLDKVFAT